MRKYNLETNTFEETYDPVIDEAETADLLIAFGRAHGATKIIQGGENVYSGEDDYLNDTIGDIIADSTGMNSLSYNGRGPENFPILITFKDAASPDITDQLKTLLNGKGIPTDKTSSSVAKNRLRVTGNVFVDTKGPDVIVYIPNMPIELDSGVA